MRLTFTTSGSVLHEIQEVLLNIHVHNLKGPNESLASIFNRPGRLRKYIYNLTETCLKSASVI